MATAKNEHIVWAYGELADGSGQVVLVGITDVGIDWMRTQKKTLLVNPPGSGFANVKQVVVFHERDKAALKARLTDAGVAVSEVM